MNRNFVGWVAKPGAILALLQIAVACYQPPQAGCVTRADCFIGEICSSGTCVVDEDDDFNNDGPKGNDASMVILPDDTVGEENPDSGMRGGTLIDGGQRDTGGPNPPPPDGGPVGTPDGGIPDSGFPCANPVTINDVPASCTIMGAVRIADAGSTIRVPDGDYVENVTIDKRLTLIGSENSKIQGSGNGVPLALNGENIRVENFRIDANGSGGVTIKGGVTVIGLLIEKAVGTAVMVSKANGANKTNANIRNVTVVSVTRNGARIGSGIIFDPDTSGEIDDCEINDAAGTGIVIKGAEVDVEDTEVNGAGRAGCGTTAAECEPGILAVDGANIEVAGGSSIRGSGAHGIHVRNSSVRVRFSSSRNNGQRADTPSDGIYVDNTAAPDANVSISASTISSNSGFGINCVTGSNANCSFTLHNGNDLGWTNCGGCQ